LVYLSTPRRVVAALLTQFREDVELLRITEEEIRRMARFDRHVPASAKYYDPAMGRK
jgi:DNA-binding protein H-NS